MTTLDNNVQLGGILGRHSGPAGAPDDTILHTGPSDADTAYDPAARRTDPSDTYDPATQNDGIEKEDTAARDGTAPTGVSTTSSGDRVLKIPSVQPSGLDPAPAHDAEIGARGTGLGQAGEGREDYVPNPEDPNVYTAPHGYSTTSSVEPTRMNKLPLTENIKAVPEGGVALHGKEGLPAGKPNALDRLVGKAQQEIGKQTENWTMYEKGVLREAGGAKAAKGEARAMI